MKCYLIDFLPDRTEIEISDIGHLFYRYIKQSETKTPAMAAREWLEIMDDICMEDWGQSLKDLGVVLP